MFTQQLEKMIVDKLGLYRGLRSASDDETLHNQAYDRVFLETLAFLNENNSLPQSDNLNESSLTGAQKELASIILRLNSIPNWEQKLLARLNCYLDNWIILGK